MNRVLVTALPVPIYVEVPEVWERPTALPAGVAFAAGHPSPDRGVRATVTIDGDVWAADETLEDLATTSVERLVDAGSQDVFVLAREHLGSLAAPALTQRVALRSASSGTLRDLVQDQVYLGLVDRTDPSRRAAVRLVLTTASEQHDQVAPTFQAIVNSVAPASAAEDETAEKR